MKKIAVILSGCGFQDGAEITESISTLIALNEVGANVTCFAPNMDYEVTDHLTGSPTGEKRNILTESARIARGQVKDLKELNADDFDGLALPGGFGAALHLCDWAKVGANATVLPKVQNAIKSFHDQSKPICACCIAPVLLAKVLGEIGVNITIGNDSETAAEIEKTGAEHVECAVTDYVTDRENKVITTPAYMYNAKPNEVFRGIQGAMNEFVEMS